MKNKYLAALLAYLLPGAGHFYQGRVFKGMLYSVCILGTFLIGLYMSQWKVVYFQTVTGGRNLAFAAQAGVGLFAIPAVVQNARFRKQAAQLNDHHRHDRDDLLPMSAFADELPIVAEFEGGLNQAGGLELAIVGQIEIDIQPGDLGQEFRGRFTGQAVGPDGQLKPLTLELAHPIEIGRTIGPGAERGLRCDVVESTDDGEVSSGWIQGHIPRSFANHFAAPLSDNDLQNLNRDLGKYFELAKIFTWIAGLLNILAVWDALDGPAYGYGDEEESTDDSDSEKTAAASKGSESTPATASAVAEKPLV